MNISPDREWMQAIRDGNLGAFKQVFDTYYEGLCRYACTFTRDADEAKDVVQSMYMKVWERRQELNIQSNVRAYLYRAVYNQCLNLLEHQKVKNTHREHQLVNWSGAVQLPEVFPQELDDKIRLAVEALPPQCRTIFMMSRYEELRYPEIATKLDISVNTIQNQICKALKILREELKDMME